MPPMRILVINPNSSEQMTASLRAPIERLNYNNAAYTFYTITGAPPSINNPTDALLSSEAALPQLLPLLPSYSAFLIACYSPHPLVTALKSHTRKPIIGIFEASIAAAVQLLPLPPPDTEEKARKEGARNKQQKQKKRRGNHKFGIISTGHIWEKVLGDAIRSNAPGMLGSDHAAVLFAGVETLGKNAGELHPGEQDKGGGGGNEQVEEVEARIEKISDADINTKTTEADIETLVRAATRRLLLRDRDVGIVILGCAGMVGMEAWVRETMDEIDDEDEGESEVDGKGEGGGEAEAETQRKEEIQAWRNIRVVDGVKAGVGILHALLRGGVGNTTFFPPAPAHTLYKAAEDHVGDEWSD